MCCQRFGPVMRGRHGEPPARIRSNEQQDGLRPKATKATLPMEMNSCIYMFFASIIKHLKCQLGSISGVNHFGKFAVPIFAILLGPHLCYGYNEFSEISASPIYTYRFDGQKWKLVDSVAQDFEWHKIYSFAFKGKTQYTTGFCCSNKLNIGAIRLEFNESQDIQSIYITNSSEAGVGSKLWMFSSRWIDHSETKFYVTEIPSSSAKKIKAYMNKHHSIIFQSKPKAKPHDE
jgi:hypothetical protein